MLLLGHFPVRCTTKWVQSITQIYYFRLKKMYVWPRETIFGLFYIMIGATNCELWVGEEKRKLCKVYICSSFKARFVSLISFLRIFIFVCILIYTAYYFITTLFAETSFLWKRVDKNSLLVSIAQKSETYLIICLKINKYVYLHFFFWIPK